MTPKLILYALSVSLVLNGCGAFGKAKGKAVVYEYAVVKRGTIEKTVSSSGSLKPVATVKVLPRMSGKVEKIYVDYNDTVHKGQILAELNTDMLRLQREQQAAQVLKARANYELQKINYQNLQKLAEKDLISEYELKNGKTSLDVQTADLSVAEANLRSIETEINQYAFITSSINGMVLERTINEGDTVVESSSSSSTAIFTLAENLEEMRIESWVGELDIASIFEGQEVRFTLESLPGKTFSGVVQSKRLQPSVQDSVVSYNIIIGVDNKDGSLLPGMTCAVEFIEERSENILLVPNAALRYQPTLLTDSQISEAVFIAGLAGMGEEQRAQAIELRQASQTTTSQSGTPSGGIASLVSGSGGMGGMPFGGGGGGRQNSAPSPRASQRETVPLKPLWFTGENGKLECVMVQVGTSDGSYTEVWPIRGASEETLEGKSIITREKVS
jgi:HlyD family secretion protein